MDSCEQLPDEETREELLTRLRRIEGQLRGLQRMIEDARDCRDILPQFSAVMVATRRAALLFACQCLRQQVADAVASGGDPSRAASEVVDLLSKLP